MIEASFGKSATAEKKVQSFFAVPDDKYAVGQSLLSQRIQGKINVVLAVFNQEYVLNCVHSEPPAAAAVFSGRECSPAPSVKKKVAPRSGSASTQTRPPCFLMMRSTGAKPLPLPLNSSATCSRWNTPNNLSEYFMSKPTPLSFTKNTFSPSFSVCPISITAGDRGREYFKALLIRFWKTCGIKMGSHS